MAVYKVFIAGIVVGGTVVFVALPMLGNTVTTSQSVSLEQESPISTIPKTEDILRREAEALHQAGDYAGAVVLYIAAIEQHGESAELYSALGHTYRYWYKFEESERAFLKAIELAPTAHWILTDIGKLYRNMEEYDKAIDVFNRSIALDPTDDLTYSYGFGYLYLQQGEIEKARTAFTKALALNPESDMALTGLGDVHYRLEEYAQAEEYYLRSVEQNPLSEALYSLGGLYLQQERAEEARDILLYYLSEKNERAEVYFTLGFAYEMLNEPEKALNAFKEAVMLNPDRADFMETLERFSS